MTNGHFSNAGRKNYTTHATARNSRVIFGCITCFQDFLNFELSPRQESFSRASRDCFRIERLVDESGVGRSDKRSRVFNRYVIYFQLKTWSRSFEMLHSRKWKQTATRARETTRFEVLINVCLKLSSKRKCFLSQLFIFLCSRWKCAVNVCDGQNENSQTKGCAETKTEEKVFPSAAGTSIRKISRYYFLPGNVANYPESELYSAKTFWLFFSWGKGKVCRKHDI